MAIDDSFLSAYFLGTADEIRSYRAKDPSSSPQFNAVLVATGVLGLLALPYALPLSVDVLCRMGHSRLKGDYSPAGIVDLISHSPGIVGLVRVLLEKK